METKIGTANGIALNNSWSRLQRTSGCEYGGSVVGFNINIQFTQPQPIIAVDVDEVVASLHVEWLKRYNKDYDDNLKDSDITRWEIEDFVKPKCGKKIYKYLEEADLYDNVPVVDGALYGVEYLRESGYRVVFVTSCQFGMHDAKWAWLMRHGFLSDKRHQQYNLVSMADKSLIRADFMIDDNLEHLKNFIRVGGRKALLFDAPHNQKNFIFERLSGWSEIGRHF